MFQVLFYGDGGGGTVVVFVAVSIRSYEVHASVCVRTQLNAIKNIYSRYSFSAQCTKVKGVFQPSNSSTYMYNWNLLITTKTRLCRRAILLGFNLNF